jgi:hypothetical protein
VKITMKFPDEFAQALRDCADGYACHPAQFVRACFRLVARHCTSAQVAGEVAQVRREAEDRQRNGASRGGRAVHD